MNNKSNSFTQKELLVRIDERQKQLVIDVQEIKGVLNRKVDYDDDFKTIKSRVSDLWDFRTKIIAIASFSGAGTAILIDVINHFIR